MREYNLQKILLSKCEFEDLNNVEKALFDIMVEDHIGNINIVENKINFNLKRVIKFVPEGKFSLFVKFSCGLVCSEKLDREEFIEDIKANKVGLLHVIAGKMSLLISNITSNTPFGAIVTIPSCNTNLLVFEK